MMGKPAPFSTTDFILDFQSPAFEKDLQILKDFVADNIRTFFSDLDEQAQSNMFALEETGSSAGWKFSKLHLQSTLVQKIYEANQREFEKAASAWSDMWSTSLGKQYVGDPFVEQLVRWLTWKIRKKGAKGYVKIGPEMADSTQGYPGSSGGGFGG